MTNPKLSRKRHLVPNSYTEEDGDLAFRLASFSHALLVDAPGALDKMEDYFEHRKKKFEAKR